MKVKHFWRQIQTAFKFGIAQAGMSKVKNPYRYVFRTVDFSRLPSSMVYFLPVMHSHTQPYCKQYKQSH